MDDQETRRKFNPLLALGIVLLPVVFVWFLLRRGHSTTARIVGFIWTALFLGAGLSASVNDRPSSPSNTPVEVASTASPEEEKARRLRTIERSPENFLTLAELSGRKDGFDTVFVLAGIIRNSSDVDIKDPRIRCALFGPSGTELGSVEETLYEIVPAGGDNRFSELNMGFLSNQQVDRYECIIVDAEALTEEIE